MTGQSQTGIARSDSCRVSIIRNLNDSFRQSFVGGRIVVTPGVAALADHDRIDLLEAVQSFHCFDGGNDPHYEHDFGAIDLGDVRYFWKIDAYDRRLAYGSPDPADPGVTTRVLTVMRADEH